MKTPSIFNSKLLAFLLLCFLSIQVSAQVIAISLDDGSFGPGLYSFNLEDPQDIEFIGPMTETYYQSGDFDEQGNYLVCDFSPKLWSVNMNTGQQDQMGILGTQISGLTYSPVLQKWFACSSDKFYEVSPSNGQVVYIADMGNSGQMFSIASNRFGQIFGVDAINNNLYEVNAATGQASIIGNTGIEITFGLDLAFDRNNGNLYLSCLVEGSSDPVLYTINTNSGNASLVGFFGETAQFTALAIPYSLPESQSVSGQITSDGQGVADALVEITDNESGAVFYLSTNSNGNYTLPNLYNGNYTFDISADGFGNSNGNSITVNASNNVFDFTLGSEGTFIRFDIVNENDQAIPGAVVQINDQFLTADQTGNASIFDVEPGIYDFTAFATGYYYRNDQVVLEGANTSMLVKLIEDSNVARDLVLIEEGSGTWCTFCPAAANGLDDLIEYDYSVAIVSYHEDDSYENEQALARLDYYNVEGFPYAIFDGRNEYNGGGTAAENQFNAYANIVLTAVDRTSPVSISIVNPVKNTAERKFGASIQVDVPGLAYGDDNRLHVILTESEIQESWLGIDQINFVARTQYKGADGLSIDISSKGNNLSIPIDLEIDEDWNIEHMTAVVFVQDRESKEILNANKIALASIPEGEVISALKETKVNLEIFPNPFKNQFQIMAQEPIKSISIFDLTGREIFKNPNLMLEKTTINTAGLPTGVYLLEIQMADGTVVKDKIVKSSH